MVTYVWNLTKRKKFTASIIGFASRVYKQKQSTNLRRVISQIDDLSDQLQLLDQLSTVRLAGERVDVAPENSGVRIQSQIWAQRMVVSDMPEKRSYSYFRIKVKWARYQRRTKFCAEHCVFKPISINKSTIKQAMEEKISPRNVHEHGPRDHGEVGVLLA